MVISTVVWALPRAHFTTASATQKCLSHLLPDDDRQPWRTPQDPYHSNFHAGPSQPRNMGFPDSYPHRGGRSYGPNSRREAHPPPFRSHSTERGHHPNPRGRNSTHWKQPRAPWPQPSDTPRFSCPAQPTTTQGESGAFSQLLMSSLNRHIVLPQVMWSFMATFCFCRFIVPSNVLSKLQGFVSFKGSAYVERSLESSCSPRSETWNSKATTEGELQDQFLCEDIF